MKYKKTMMLLVLVVFLLSIAGVSASEIGDTIASENANTIELFTDNDIIEDNLQTSEENEALASTDYDEALSAQTDTEVLGADSAKYSDLANEISQSGNITLSHKNYTYDWGGNILISEDNKVIDGNGAVIDMKGSTISAFTVTASGVTIKNLTIKNANYDGHGGAIYFSSSATSGTVSNCNFTNNQASGNGGAVFFYSAGIVTNCNFINNTATSHGGAVYFESTSNVANCNFADNSASRGGDICSWNWYTAADTCIFKRNSGDNVNVVIYPPTLNVDNFTTFYGSGEKLTFNLTTDSGMPVNNGNISISVYFKDDNSWVRNYSCLSGEGWAVSLPVGSYYANFTTEYAGFQAISRTIKIIPNIPYYVNVTPVTTNNRTVNITAKSNIPQDIMEGKLLFILPNGDVINATYAKDGIWWAVHTFDDYGEYQVNASYTELSNVTINNAIISISKASLNLNATYNVSVLDDGFAANIIVNTDPVVNGILTIKFNGREYPAEVVNGTANFTSKKVYSKTYKTDIFYPESDQYLNSSTTLNAVVKSTKVTRLNTFTYYYYNTDMGSDSKKGISKINVIDVDGNPIKNGVVTINFMDMYRLKVRTDASGIAEFTKAYKPGTYTVIAQHNNKTTKLGNMVIKSVVNLPKLSKVSKSAKTTTIKITLKGTGPIKGKSVIVTFMKKQYTIKTDKNGVAQFKVTQSMVSKLIAGKTYKIRATYMMDSVAQGIQILK